MDAIGLLSYEIELAQCIRAAEAFGARWDDAAIRQLVRLFFQVQSEDGVGQRVVVLDRYCERNPRA